jgi:hypothetical protein
VEWG